MTITDQEAHCIARLMQGALFGKHPLDACNYCKFQCGNLSGFNHIRKRLTDETGVDLSPYVSGFLPDSDFPYHKFLKNANEEIKHYFRTRFNEIS